MMAHAAEMEKPKHMGLPLSNGKLAQKQIKYFM